MKTIGSAVLGLIVVSAGLLAQTKAPQVKSQKEAQAIMAVQQATTPQARITAIDNVLDNFADTEYKAALLQIAAATYQQLGNYEKMVIYAERTLEADPKNYQALLMLATGYAQHTREFDLDKEEKLNKADSDANKAMELIKTADKPNPNIPDEQWASAKKDMMSECYAVLGMTASLRKKYDVAITNYKASLDAAATPDPGTQVRLAAAYDDAGKPDEALPILDKVLAMPDLQASVKSVAMSEKNRATRLKGGAAAPKPPAAGEVEIKK